VTDAPEPLSLEPAFDRALVTGAGTGIGRGIALALARAGVDVVAMGRRPEPLEETRDLAATLPGRVDVQPGNIRDEHDVDRVFAAAERDGPVPMLVHAAAGAFLAYAEDISPNGFRAVVDTGLNGAFLMFRRWARPLIDAGRPGVTTVVSSALGAREVPGAAHSSAAKAGLEALIRSLAVEWGRYGLRLNVVAPGAVSTEGADEGMWSDRAVHDRALNAIPLGRFGTVEEVVAAAMLLLSRQGAYITGSSIYVDGGWRLGGWPFMAPASPADAAV
jgi:NAD(P)-dependent dehydrogenase (short-subunit alcohol dehydrogenase family)